MRPGIKGQKINFYYFSGTGNTALVVRRMCEVFSSTCQVRLRRMEVSEASQVEMDGVIGLGFPVAMQSTYPLVWNFVRSLPRAKGSKVFMVDTLMSFSGGIVGPMRRLLESKGYEPIGAKEIMMPLNFGRLKTNTEKDQRKIAKGLQEAERYAQALLDGTTYWGRIPVLSDLMYLVGTSSVAWRSAQWLGHKFRVDREKCNDCGLCARLCPVSNIHLTENGPQYADRCQLCLRCTAVCPQEAITYPIWRFRPYRAPGWPQALMMERDDAKKI